MLLKEDWVIKPVIPIRIAQGSGDGVGINTTMNMRRYIDTVESSYGGVVDGFWIETLGCCDAADIVGEENQWEDHYKIYDEYTHDGVSPQRG